MDITTILPWLLAQPWKEIAVYVFAVLLVCYAVPAGLYIVRSALSAHFSWKGVHRAGMLGLAALVVSLLLAGVLAAFATLLTPPCGC